MEKLELIIAFLSSLSAIIALIMKLKSTIASLINEKKYSELFEIISDSIIEAETIRSLSGEEKKTRVMDTAQKAADALGIEEFDAERISSLIDLIVDVSKRVNVK